MDLGEDPRRLTGEMEAYPYLTLPQDEGTNVPLIYGGLFCSSKVECTVCSVVTELAVGALVMIGVYARYNINSLGVQLPNLHLIYI